MGTRVAVFPGDIFPGKRETNVSFPGIPGKVLGCDFVTENVTKICQDCALHYVKVRNRNEYMYFPE